MCSRLPLLRQNRLRCLARIDIILVEQSRRSAPPQFGLPLEIRFIAEVEGAMDAYQPAPGESTIRVLVADSSRIHTRLLADALKLDPLLEVIPFEADSSGLIGALVAQCIDVLIISSNLDEQPSRGLEILLELRERRLTTRAVLLPDSSKDEAVLKAFRAGARGVFGSNEPIAQLNKCVRCVHQGQIWADSQALRVAVEALASSPTVPEAELRQTSGYDGPFLSAGEVIWGHEASVGYFAQDHRALIEKGMTAFEWLHRWDPGAANEEIRGLLGQMLFARDDGNKRTEVLSGGEAARLLFCKLMLQKPNVLVLDEPTNHLDLESINALNIALQRYPGTVLLVTHDHDLIDEVATRIWHFEGDHQVTDFKGAYEEYQSVPAA